MSSFITRIINNKWYLPADPNTASFTGLTILITGSNTGLGYEAAIKFAQLTARRIILGVRNTPAGEIAARTIKHLASDPDCQVEVWHLDMLSYASVQAFAKRASEELEYLDVAILNAGVYRKEFHTCETTGWEETLQVNTLSTVLLTMLLLPKMKNAKREQDDGEALTPTLQLVSSGLHYKPVLTTEMRRDQEMNVLEEFNRPEVYVAGKQYPASKLFLMHALNAIEKMVVPNAGGDPLVYVTSVGPGAVSTDLGRDYDSLAMRIVKYYIALFLMRNPEQGARSLVSGATLGKKGHGMFWQNDEVKL